MHIAGGSIGSSTGGRESEVLQPWEATWALIRVYRKAVTDSIVDYRDLPCELNV